MRNVLDRSVEKIIFVFSLTFFFYENLAVYVIMRKNVVEPDRPQMTIWRMIIACWLPRAINTQTLIV